MLRVAIACESSDTEADVYATLVQLVLGEQVERFRLGMSRFSGWHSVYTLGPVFLRAASARGVRHAVLAVDNDGGAVRHPEHGSHPPYPPPLPAETDKSTLQREARCRTCTLAAIAPSAWAEADHWLCIAVPVQALETWLLCLQGSSFGSPTPEQSYDRRALKRRCYGQDMTAVQRRDLALDLLGRSGSLATLRARPSFQRFEECVRAWRASKAELPP